MTNFYDRAAREKLAALPERHYPVQITAPRTPGAQSTVVWQGDTVDAARVAADRFVMDRRDLNHHDVRIETSAGQRIEYAGPSR